MRGKLRAFFFLFTVFSAFSNGGLEIPGPEWVKIMEYKPREINPVIGNGISYGGFLTPDRGITVGPVGYVFFTTDGTLNWFRANNIRFDLYGLEILNEQEAWIVGSYGMIYRSRDGGVRWFRVAVHGKGYPEHNRYISFCSSFNGWVASRQELSYTVDGGEKWLPLSLPGGLTRIGAIHLLTPRRGYVLDDSTGVLYYTKDMGESWNEIQLPIASGNGFKPACPDSVIRFVDEWEGTIILRSPGKSDSWTILSTVDGGWRWKVDTLTLSRGYLFLSRDRKTLTHTSLKGDLTIFQW